MTACVHPSIPSTVTAMSFRQINHPIQAESANFFYSLSNLLVPTHTMEPMRRPGDLPTGYESGIIKECALLSVPVIDSVHLGVALRWNTKSIQEFAQVANTEPISDQLPVWISQPRGQITAQSLKSDIIAYLRDVSGGLNSANHLGPNTLQQHWNITKRLAHIEDEGFIQACMARLDVDASLAEVYVVYESPGFGCQPARFEPPPAPKRQVFL